MTVTEVNHIAIGYALGRWRVKCRVCGMATDYCVQAEALSARRLHPLCCAKRSDHG